jgi:hypothetical protein
VASRRKLDDLPWWIKNPSAPGRRPGPNPKVRHRARPEPAGAFSALVTLKLKKGLPSLRERRIARELAATFEEGGDRGDFRIARYRLQTDRVELLVEAEHRDALMRGMKSIAARVGRAVNRALARRGSVLGDRYELKVLATPAEIRRVRAALASRRRL